MSTEEKGILVLGIGNLLLTDDGVGIHVVRELERRDLPGDVEVVDGGTTGFELVRYCLGKRVVVIVDAVRLCRPPGTVVRFGLGDVIDPASIPYSPHQCGPPDLLRALRDLSPAPDVRFYGVVPRETNLMSVDLSPEVAATVPLLADRILRDLVPSHPV